MKKLFLLLTVVSACITGFSQQTISVTPGASFSIYGNANVVLNNTTVNNAGKVVQHPGEGNIVFEGSDLNLIKGTGKTELNHLVLSKESEEKVVVNNNVKVKSDIRFASGILEARNSIIDLSTKGVLINERPSSYLVATGTGYAIAKRNIRGFENSNPGNLGLRISSPAILGETTIIRGNENAAINGGYSSNRYYQVMPANNTNLNATLQFQYFDHELNNLGERSIALYENDNNKWVEKGVDSRESTANFVVKQRVNSLSKYTLYKSSEKVKVYPNPVRDYANVTIESLSEGTATLEIVDAKGGTVLSQEKDLSEGSNNVQLNTKGLSSGNYTFRTRISNEVFSVKLFKN